MKNTYGSLASWLLLGASIFLFSSLAVDFEVAKAVASTLTATPTLVASATPVPSTSLPDGQRISVLETQAAELENKIENPPRDLWDKISGISPLVGGILVALIGLYATRVYDKQKIEVAKRNSKINEYKTSLTKSNTIKNFMPYLTPTKNQQREIAILAIRKVDNIMADEIDGILDRIEQVPEQQGDQPVPKTRNQARKRKNR